MLRTVGLLALPRRTLSAGFDGGISPSWRFVAAQLLGGWDLTETGLSPASHSRLLWTHNSSALRQALHRRGNEIAWPQQCSPFALSLAFALSQFPSGRPFCLAGAAEEGGGIRAC